MALAIITGASSGIGKEYALKLGEKGYDLFLIGRREEKLIKVKKEIEESFKVKIEYRLVNLDDEKEIESLIKELEKRENIEVLINNAGYGGGESFLKDRVEFSENMIRVHINATIKLTRACSELMKRNKKGYIINTSSMAGFNQFKDSAMYCSTKAFLISFSECLGLECMEHNIKVQVLCPGFVRTDFHEKLDMDERMLQNKGIIRWMNTEEVVKYSLKRIFNNKKYNFICIPGFLNKILYYSIRLMPKKMYYKITSRGWEYMDEK